MPTKPKKMRDESSGRERTDYPAGYNQSCDDWEKWLPTVEELTKWVDTELEKYISSHGARGEDYTFTPEEIAKAIAKRLKGEV